MSRAAFDIWKAAHKSTAELLGVEKSADTGPLVGEGDPPETTVEQDIEGCAFTALGVFRELLDAALGARNSGVGYHVSGNVAYLTAANDAETLEALLHAERELKFLAMMLERARVRLARRSRR